MTFSGRYALLFLLAYLVALAATVPARFITPFLPTSFQPAEIKGTVWAGNFWNLRWKNVTFSFIRWQWKWYNGLPGIHVTFDGSAGGGQATVGWAGSWRIADARWKAPVQTVLSLSGMVLPIEATGELSLMVDQLHFDARTCHSLAATLVWQHAALGGGTQQWRLNTPQMTFSCQKQQVNFILQQSQAPLSFRGEGAFTAHGWRFSGQTGPTSALPEPWRKLTDGATRAGEGGQRIMEVSGKWMLQRP